MDDISFFRFMLYYIFFVALLVFLIFLPLSYLDGSAKSAFLKEQRGIELPWYQSTFLSVQINDANISVKE